MVRNRISMGSNWILAGAVLFFCSLCMAQQDMSLLPDETAWPMYDMNDDLPSGGESLAASSAWAFLQLIFVLVAIIGLAYLVLHRGVGFFVKKSQSNKLVQVKERIALDQKRFLYLVDVADHRFLLGGSDGGVSLISEIKSAPLSPSSLHQGPAPSYDQKSFKAFQDRHYES